MVDNLLMTEYIVYRLKAVTLKISHMYPFTYKLLEAVIILTVLF